MFSCTSCCFVPFSLRALLHFTLFPPLLHTFMSSAATYSTVIFKTLVPSNLCLFCNICFLDFFIMSLTIINNLKINPNFKKIYCFIWKRVNYFVYLFDIFIVTHNKIHQTWTSHNALQQYCAFAITSSVPQPLLNVGDV